MKSIVISVLAFISIGSLFSLSQQTGPAMQLAETFHDFGDVTEGQEVEYVFKYTNTGNQSLVLTQVHTTCGCTVPKWSTQPLAVGKTGEILVHYNSAGKSGIQNKQIIIQSNAANADPANPMKVTIRVNVLPKK